MRLRTALALAIVVAGVLVALGVRQSEPRRSEYCVARVGSVVAQVDLEQARWSALMSALAQRRGMPPRATSIAIATAFQESKIHNIDHGDRDSIGLFQQRPSQGWGTVEQIMDPHYSIDAFYDALAQLDGYEGMAINDAAQAVQRSGFPEAYGQHEEDARALASALRGYSPAAFTCQLNPAASGNTTAVTDEVFGAFGEIAVDATADVIRFPLTGADDDVSARGWGLAHFLVANAANLGVSSVSFDGQQWTSAESDQGWQVDESARGDVVAASVN